MFVADETSLEISFAVARERLAQLAQSDVLVSSSEDAYSHETATDIMHVGAGGLSKLVRVQVRELAWTGTSAGLAIRWEATGPGGGLFPVLDADIRLAPAGERATLLTLAGSYRPPLGALGDALDRRILHRVAAATIRRFLTELAVQVGGQQQRLTPLPGVDPLTVLPPLSRLAREQGRCGAVRPMPASGQACPEPQQSRRTWRSEACWASALRDSLAETRRPAAVRPVRGRLLDLGGTFALNRPG
jgi:hypothetical protein